MSIEHRHTDALACDGNVVSGNDHAVLDMAENAKRLFLTLLFLAADVRNDVADHLRPVLEILACAGNSQRNFATRENLPTYPEKIAALKAEGARLVLVYGIGRMCHIAFWEPTFAQDFSTDVEWEAAPYRIAAKIHPLTVEQNALTSFKSRTTLVPCRANTIGPGLFLKADYAIGGADGTLGRGMQWQGMSLWMTLRHGTTPWITSSYIPTLPGRLFFLSELAGPLVADCN